MYRGNLPGQYNGNRIQDSQVYPPHPNYTTRFSQSGQIPPHQQSSLPPNIHGHHLVQGQPSAGASSEMHSSFQGTGYTGGMLQGQGPFAISQTSYSSPYAYGQSKIATSNFSSQSYPTHSVSSSHTHNSSHRYGMQNQGQSTMGYVSNRLSDIPSVTDTSMHQYQTSKSIPSWPSNKPHESSQIMSYGPRDASVDMYNGSQLNSGLAMSGGTSSQSANINQSHQPLHAGYPRMSAAASSLQPQPYQMSSNTDDGRNVSGTNVPYQQPSMASPYSSSVGNSMYSNQQAAQQYNQTSRPINPSAVSYGNQNVSQMQHTGQYHPQMRSNPSYSGLEDPSSASSGPIQQSSGISGQHTIKPSGPSSASVYNPKMHSTAPNMHSNQQQVLAGHQLQQTMSPRHTTPLSPIRARTNNPSAVSPQMSTSSPRQQMSTSQQSPRLPSQTPPQQQPQRTPSPLTSVFSPRQQQQQQPHMIPSQTYPTQGYRPSTPSSQHTADQQAMNRGFMSPPQQMMSPPPSSVGARLHGSYNGDVMQHPQKSHVYTGRYPHTGSTWQNSRVGSQQTSVASNHGNSVQYGMQSSSSQQMHHHLQQQKQTSRPHPLSTNYSSSDQQKSGLQQQQRSSSHETPQQPASAPPKHFASHQNLPTPATTSECIKPPSDCPPPSTPQQPASSALDGNDFDENESEFNLESLLNDPMGGAVGSFMQQLQEVTPTEIISSDNDNSAKVSEKTTQGDKNLLPAPVAAGSDSPKAITDCSNESSSVLHSPVASKIVDSIQSDVDSTNESVVNDKTAAAANQQMEAKFAEVPVKEDLKPEDAIIEEKPATPVSTPTVNQQKVETTFNESTSPTPPSTSQPKQLQTTTVPETTQPTTTEGSFSAQETSSDDQQRPPVSYSTSMSSDAALAASVDTQKPFRTSQDALSSSSSNMESHHPRSMHPLHDPGLMRTGITPRDSNMIRPGVSTNDAAMIRPTVSPRDPNMMRPGAPRDPGMLRPGAPPHDPGMLRPGVAHDPSIMRTGAPHDPNMLRPGVPHDPAIMRSGAPPHDPNMMRSVAPPHDPNMMRPGVPPHDPNMMRPGVPHDPNMMRPGAPHDPNMMRPGAPPHDPSMMRPGAPPHDPSMMRPGAPPHDPNMMRPGAPHDPNMMRPGAPHDPNIMRPGAPSHYPPMRHPMTSRHPVQPHPYQYGPQPNNPQYPGGPPVHGRPQYPPQGTNMGMRPSFIGPSVRPPYGNQPIHPQQQHLHVKIQALKQEAHQIQTQIQHFKQEEAMNRNLQSPPETGSHLADHSEPPHLKNLRMRLCDIEMKIRQINVPMRKAIPATSGGPGQLMGLSQNSQDAMTSLPNQIPGYPPQDFGDISQKSDDPTSQNKPKKKRKQKPSKGPKNEDDEGHRKDRAPPKKKKKKEPTEGDETGEKKKKKRSKKQSSKSRKPSDETGDKKDASLMEGISDVRDISFQDSSDLIVEASDSNSAVKSLEDRMLTCDYTDDFKPPIRKEDERKKRKKPPATLVKPKKKRKRGYDSGDELNSVDLPSTPPSSLDNNLIEKRRSGRNVKRKRYTESIDLHFSGDDDDEATDVQLLADSGKKSGRSDQQVAEIKLENVAEEEVLIVEKILSHRIRKRRPKKKSSIVEGEEAESRDEAAKVSDQVDGDEKVEALQKQDDPKEESEEEEVEGEGQNEFFLKFKNYSYLHCEWKLKSEIEDKRFEQKLRRYLQKHTSHSGHLIYPDHEADELFNPDFVEVDRVLDVMVGEEKPVKHYLVKWCSLAYEESTWERECDVEKTKINEFEARCSIRPPSKKVMRPHKDLWKRLTQADTLFRNNNKLRDYQFEGVNWLLFNWYNRRNCILADEMGLGKTIQSITFLQKIFDHNIMGPFLIVAPLSTIANWQREFESWTSINAVIYHGSQTSRDMIRTYEWLCRDENLDEIEGSYKMQAVITTYEMVVLETPHLMDVEWKCLIIDEAHRLKNLSCKLVECLRSMSLEHKVLLTGTPLQNNVEELFALLSFLQPETFYNQNAFSTEFGNLKDQSQVEKLQELLKPMMLRRLKGDVEKSLAPKQETIIEVELTSIQKKYYRAILERNFEFLSKGAVSGNVPNLMNTMMELRKCCNHPYLIKGAEDKITEEQSANNEYFDCLQAMIQSSGKLVLIDKLLPRLYDGGHKVLVFSQMVRVLDILEDYLVQRSYQYERLDGCIRGNERQMAIDRFSRKGSDRFVFLLCTRAGGLGINLTAADTVIIFDSDWNPQNDLQAQARCHRIGQSKPVKIYRLITRNSYEREMFDKASLKLGLDKAVLQSMSGRQDSLNLSSSAPQLSKKEVEDLLKKGAYGAVMEDDEAASKFCEEDIDQILDRRAHTVTLESGEKGSTFSKASFVSAEDQDDISLDDPNFWEKWAKKADLDLGRMKDNKLILEHARRRKQTARFGGGNSEDPDILAEIGSDSDDSEYESGGEEGSRTKKSKYRSRAGGAGGGQRKGWGRRDCFRIEKCLLTYGWGRWNTMQARGGFNSSVSPQELEEMARTVLMFCLKYYNGDEKIKSFMWDLITPENQSVPMRIDLRNHEGLTAPVPRGRKGRRTKEDTGCFERFAVEQSARDWAKIIEVDSSLADEGFRKHIQHQCNKVLLRVRMLHYLRVEILAGYTDLIESEAKPEDINFELIEKIPELPASWWNSACDKSLLIGVYRHGYEKYNLIRADKKLVFLEQVGPPDERALAAEIDVEPDDADNDPEYKPTRISFPEMEFETQDSPSVSTPNTAPPSPSSIEDSKFLRSEGKNEEKKKRLKRDAVNEWPTMSELNARLRRIITAYQKYNKQKQQRILNAERRNVNARARSNDSPRPDSRRGFSHTRWTRREEADFYRTVSTFGIERDPHCSSEFNWKRFRNIARLDRKTDASLRGYYLAFRNMCERACRWSGKVGHSDGTGMGLNEEIPNIDVDPITEERANRTIYRIKLLDKIRTKILVHPDIQERLKLCKRSVEMPIWWKNGVHDFELLLAMDRHGVTKTEIHTLNDPDMTFQSCMKEYELNPSAFKQKILIEEQAELDAMLKIQEEQKKLEDEIKKKETEEKEKQVKEEEDKKEEKEIKSEVSIKERDEDVKDIPDVKQDLALEEKKKDKEEAEMEVDEVKKVEDLRVDAEEVMKDVDEKSEDKEKVEEVIKTEVSADKKEEEVLKKSSDNPPEEEEQDKKDLDAEKEDKKTKKVDELKCEAADEEVKKDKDAVAKESDKDVTEASNSVETKSKDVQDSDLPSKDAPKTSKRSSEEKSKAEKPNKVETLQMSLRSKNLPPTSNDNSPLSLAVSNLNDYLQTSAFISLNQTGRWPKDRVLISRVEQVTYCVEHGEWPSASQTLLFQQIAAGGSVTPTHGNSASGSDVRSRGVTPSPSAPSNLASMADFSIADDQLQAALMNAAINNQLRLQPPYSQPSSNSSSSKRFARRRQKQTSYQQSAAPLSFAGQNMPGFDKALQQKLEQMMVDGNMNFSTEAIFSALNAPNPTGKSPILSQSSKDEDKSGEMSKSSLRSRHRISQQSSSPFMRAKDSSSNEASSKMSSAAVANEFLKQQTALLAATSPEQIFGNNNPMNQIMNEVIKAGLDPMTALACSLMPVDPFQMINPNFMMNQQQTSSSSKRNPKSQQMSSSNQQMQANQMPVLPVGEIEKLMKSMGITPEMLMMQGIFPGFSGMMPPQSSAPNSSAMKSQDLGSSSKQNPSPSTPKEDKGSSSSAGSSIASSIFGDKRNPPKKKGGSKLDAIFGIGSSSRVSDDSSSGSKSNKKSRKMKFVSPAMLPKDTRIPVINNAEGTKKSGDNAPLNDDLADFLADNPGYAVNYQALRQQLDDNEVKKSEEASAPPGGECVEMKAVAKEESLSKTEELQKSKEEDSDESEKRAKDHRTKTDSRKLNNPKMNEELRRSPSAQQRHVSSLKQKELEMALMQVGTAASFGDPNAINLLSLPPEIIASLSGLPPGDVTTLMAGGLISPELLAAASSGAATSSRLNDESKPQPRSSPSIRQSTQAHASSSLSPNLHHNKHASSSRPPSSGDKPVTTDPNLLKGDERVAVINLGSGRKLTGRQAPELKALAEYLRSHPEVYVAPEWNNVLKKANKYLSKDLHSRLLPLVYGKTSTSATDSTASLQASIAASGIPPQLAASMYPNLMQGAGMMNDPLQLMMALQQLPPTQQQHADIKNMVAAVAASSMPFLHFFGGVPNSMMGGGGFPGQDPTMAALAAMSGQNSSSVGSSAPKKEHPRSSSDSSQRGRKSKKESTSRMSTSINKQQQASSCNQPTDPVSAAIAMLQRQPGGGFPGVGGNFLGANPMMYPQMMMAASGQQPNSSNNLSGIPMDLMNPDLLAAQMATFGFPGMPQAAPSKPPTNLKHEAKNDRKPPTTPAASSFSSSSSSKRKDSPAKAPQLIQPRSTGSKNGNEDQPMDLTHLPSSKDPSSSN